MYATSGADRYTMIKIEERDRLARAQRRFAGAAIRSPAPPLPESVFEFDIGSATLRRRAAVALVTFLLGLGLLSGAAAAQDRGTASTAAANECVVAARTVC